MEQVVRKFRTSLGGFNRRDVMSYIEEMYAAHSKQVDALEAELAETRNHRESLEGELAGLKDEKGSVAAEEAKVRASLEESTQTLSRVRGELSQAESKLAVARAELARLQEQVALLEPTAQKYEELKDRVATVELDAHRKAQATVDEAQAQVEAMKEGAQQWISGILGQYDDNPDDNSLSNQLRQAVDELDRRLQAVGSLAAGMSGGDEGANRLRQWGGVE